MVTSTQKNSWDKGNGQQARRKLAHNAHFPPFEKRFRSMLRIALPLILTVVAGLTVMLPATLPTEVRSALFGFAVATILWSTTKLHASYVALGSVIITTLTGGGSQELLFQSLASDVIWLMIGAFILGGAMQATGLAERLASLIVNRARTVRGVLWLLTTVLQFLSFFVPSTSGRAAVVMPIFHSISHTVGEKAIRRTLALLIPTIILVTTISTLIGASSHLIAVDMLRQTFNQNISFAQWVLWGFPFGVTASYVSCWVIMRLFLDKECLHYELQPRERRPGVDTCFSRNQKFTLAVLLLMIGLWLTEALHGIQIATVTVVGALILTLPGFGVIRWKEGINAVSWNLILFVGAALALGRTLIESGAAQWLIDQLFSLCNIDGMRSTFLILLVIGVISLTSHLYITSHTTRAVVMIPPILYFASSLNLNATAVLFICTVGMDYCLTFPVSSKALLMFQETDEETFQPTDLLRLSSILIIVHILLIIVFYYGYWKWTGLAL